MVEQNHRKEKITITNFWQTRTILSAARASCMYVYIPCSQAARIWL